MVLSLRTLSFLCALTAIQAQTVDPTYSSVYNVTVLGSVAGVPTNYGGLLFSAADSNMILLGGNANSGTGRFYSVPAVRGTGGPRHRIRHAHRDRIRHA